MAMKQVASGARRVASAVRNFLLNCDFAVVFLPGTLIHKMDQQQMKEVNTQDQRISKVPLVLGDSVQPALGSPWPKTLLGCVSFDSDERA